MGLKWPDLPEIVQSMAISDALRYVTPIERYRLETQTTRVVAKQLLGQALVVKNSKGWTLWRIVELEAYLGIKDPACHSYRGRKTLRNQSMWGPAGHAYVYLIYGMYFCLNLVTQKPGVPEAILIRAIEPVLPDAQGRWPWDSQWQGFDYTWIKRNRRYVSGPGRLCRFLGIDRRWDGWDLTQPEGAVWIGLWNQPWPCGSWQKAPRQGIDSVPLPARLWPLRYYIQSNLWVSDPKPSNFEYPKAFS